MKPGIYPNLSNEDYHADEAISRSNLLDFKISPYHYKYKVKKDQTPDMLFGSAYHSFMLEPDKFAQEYGVEPPKILLKDTDRKTYDDYKKQCENLENSGRAILSYKDYATLKSMRNAVLDHRDARDLLEGAKYEHSVFWQDPETEIMVKCKPDIWHENMIVDLKTCASASPRDIASRMAESGYHIQAAMMIDGIKATTGKDLTNFVLLCVEKTPPYAIGIYIIDEEAIEAGRQEYKALLKSLKHCIMYSEFPSYEIQTLNLPRWYY